MIKNKPEPYIIAFYLPQFHTIPENNKWWGDGFTEWVNVKRAKPLIKGQRMPFLPHPDIGYYDLADESTLVRQAAMAKLFGVSGFCFYHYWFKGKLLLEKPLFSFLRNPEINIGFCLCWANESWTRNWNGGDEEVLQEQNYGDRDDWINHFDWLVPFLTDPRAIRFKEAPMILIYRTGHISKFNEMVAVWRERAREKGIGNICIGGILNFHKDSYEIKNLDLDAVVEFQPFFALRSSLSKNVIQKVGNNTVIRYPELIKACTPVRFHLNQIPGVCPCWDNTPRHLDGGATIFTDCNELLFAEQLRCQFAKIDIHNPFVFINAWNEWAEGCALEPDVKDGYSRLETLKRVLEEWRNI